MLDHKAAMLGRAAGGPQWVRPFNAKTADGVSIAFLTVGDGPPIVFASNIFGDAHCYRHLSGHHVRGVTDGLAARGWQVARYDVRGMGASDRTVADLSLDARVADLEAVVTSLGLDRLALAGVDLGAATALASRPDVQRRP